MQYDLETMIKEVEVEKKVKTAVSIAKIAAHGRGLLEGMDELQGTNVYSGKIRGLVNRLDAEITKHNKINTDNDFANAIIQDISMKIDDLFINYESLLLTNYKKSLEIINDN